MSSFESRIANAFGLLGKRKAASQTPAAPDVGANQDKSGKRLSFRPWDQKDLHRRLETFKPLTWFGKPDECSAVECARKGWINDGRDSLKCEFCDQKLLYPQSRTFEERGAAARLFHDQLSERHEAHCPWKSTRCDDSVFAYDPAAALIKATGNPPKHPSIVPPAADGDGEGPILRLSIPEELTRAFNARIAKLSNVDRLPDVYPRALDTLADHAASSVMCVDPKDPHKSQDRGPNLLRQALALPAPPAAAAAEAPEVEMADAAPTPARGARAPPVLPSNLTKAQKARLLALLGWDAEELPAGSAERPRSITSAYQPTSGAYALAHLVGDPAGGRSDAPGAAAAAETAAADHQHPLCSDNVVLNCQECRSRVGLWNFNPTRPQPILALPAPPSASTTASSTPAITSPAASAAGSATPGNITTAAPAAAVTAGGVAASTSDGGAAPAAPVPLVPLGATIAGGTYNSVAGGAAGTVAGAPAPAEATPAPAGVSGAGPPGGGVFGSAYRSSMPVYGLEALSSAPLPGRASSGLQHALSASLPPAAAAAAGSASQASPPPTGPAAGLKRKHSEDEPMVPAAAGAAGGSGTEAMATDEGAGSVFKKARVQMSTSPPPQPAGMAGSEKPQLFDPLQHHRMWCPWIFTGSKPVQTGAHAASNGAQAGASNGAATPKSAAAAPGTPAAPATPGAATAGGTSTGAATPGAVDATATAATNGPRIRCGWMHLLDSLDQSGNSAAAAAAGTAAAGATPPAGAMGGAESMDLDRPDGMAVLETGPGMDRLTQIKDRILQNLNNL